MSGLIADPLSAPCRTSAFLTLTALLPHMYSTSPYRSATYVSDTGSAPFDTFDTDIFQSD